MTTFYLIRHGKKAHAVGDVPLSSAGRGEARATARYLQDRRILCFYTSPLRRAKETAAIIAAAQRLPAIEDVRLRERANWGDLPGQSFAEFVAMWERTTRDPTYAPPVGDSAVRAATRLASFIEETARSHPRGAIVAVTHGGLIADFLVRAFAEEELDRWHPAFIASQSLLIPECSMTVVVYDEGKYTLMALAETGHLS